MTHVLAAFARSYHRARRTVPSGIPQSRVEQRSTDEATVSDKTPAPSPATQAVDEVRDLEPKELTKEDANAVKGGLTSLQQMQHETAKAVIQNIRA